MMRNFKSTNLTKGFTLIELLIVIAIIGMLAALSLVSFTGAQQQSRDVRRESDLKQYQAALESYANTHSGLYPIYAGGVDPSTTLCAALGLSNCPTDPKYDPADSPPARYTYTSDTAGTKYALSAYLEKAKTYLAVCSNGKVGTTNGANGFCGVTP